MNIAFYLSLLVTALVYMPYYIIPKLELAAVFQNNPTRQIGLFIWGLYNIVQYLAVVAPSIWEIIILRLSMVYSTS